MISKTQFVTLLQRFGMTPIDVLSLQRVVGFVGDVQKLSVNDVMLKITERSKMRG